MCGHIGVLGKKLSMSMDDAIEDGLFISALRGSDSIGIGCVPYEEKLQPFVQKRLGMAPVWFRSPFSGAKALIGHVRSATIGGKDNKDLAHPFLFDNILGAHNGTLRGDWRAVLQDQTNEVFGSDSQAIFYNFAYWGVKETIESIYGAWCLVWWDEDECTLNMLRNDERPLWTARGKDGNLYWASEHWMINGMLRAGEKDRDKLVKTKMEGKEEERFFHKLPQNVWRRWSFDEAGEVVQLDDIPLEGKAEPVYVAPEKKDADPNLPGDSFVYARYEAGKWVEGTDASDGALKLNRAYFDGAPNTKGLFYRVVSGVPYVSRPGSAEITFSEFMDFKTDGCCTACGTNIFHPSNIGYLPKDLSWFLCRDCANDWVKEAKVDNISELLEMMDEEVEETGKPEGMVDPTQDFDTGDNRMVTMGRRPLILDDDEDVWKDEDSPWVITTSGGHILLGTGCKTRKECVAYVAKAPKGSNLRAMRRSTAEMLEQNDNDLADDGEPPIEVLSETEAFEMEAKIEAAMQADAEAAYAASVDPDRQRRSCRSLRREKARAALGPFEVGPSLHDTERDDVCLPFDAAGRLVSLPLPKPTLTRIK